MRRRGYRPPMVKNIYQNSNFGVVAGTTTEEIIASAVATPANGTNEVAIGSRVKRIWVDAMIFAQAANAIGVVCLMKNPGRLVPLTDISALGANNGKKFYWNMIRGIPGLENSGYPHRIQGWVPVPKIYQKFNEGDSLSVVIRNNNAALSYCLLAVYRWSK